MTKAVTRNDAAQRPDNHVIVLFGATGDLARRKLLPGLFHLHAAGLLPREYRVIGSAPPSFAMTDEQFRAHAKDAVGRVRHHQAGRSILAVVRRPAVVRRRPNPATRPPWRRQSSGRRRRSAGPPGAFITWPCRRPRSPRSSACSARPAWPRDARVIIEKPFGTDLDSARALNQAVHAVFDESQVFRIDHFLGKESVDNILAFRFANGLFEPVWNREHIRYVQIDVPEKLSHRGPGRVLRRHRRLPGHDRHAPVPGAWGSWPWSRRCRCRPSTCGTRR